MSFSIMVCQQFLAILWARCPYIGGLFAIIAVGLLNFNKMTIMMVSGLPDDDMAEAFSQPHFSDDANRSAVVQLFEWRFTDVAEECRTFLGPYGFGGVQLSPITEHLMVSDDGSPSPTVDLAQPWPARYQPVSYRIASRLGDEAAFVEMVKVCNEAGVRVYVEVVLNHMAATAKWLLLTNKTAANAGEDGLVHGTAGGEGNALKRNYPSVPYATGDFNKPCQHLGGTSQSIAGMVIDGHELRNCQLWDTGPDLIQSGARVRARIIELLDKLIGMGVAGFRVHGTERMWPMDLKAIFMAVRRLNSEEFNFEPNSRPLFYMDVDDVTYIHAVSKTEYTAYGLVLEHLHAARLADIVRRQQLSALINWGPAMGFVAHQQAVVYVDNLRQQRLVATTKPSPVITFRQQQHFILASAFMLAHPYGRFKLLMSSFRFNRRQGTYGPPPSIPEGGDICSLESGWVCEHRWPPLRRLIAMVNALDDIQDGVINFQANGPDQIAFCRGHHAFIAFNSNPERSFSGEYHTCLPEGIYCDIIGGERNADGLSCSGMSVQVNEEGLAWIEVPPLERDDDVDDDVDEEKAYSVLAIHILSKLLDEDDVEELALTETPLEMDDNETEDDMVSEPDGGSQEDAAVTESELEPEPVDNETTISGIEEEEEMANDVESESPKDDVEILTDETEDATTPAQNEVGDILFEEKKF